MWSGQLSPAQRADLAHYLRVDAARLLAETTAEFVRAIAALHEEGEPIKRIAERFGLTRQRVYTLLEESTSFSPVVGIGALEVAAATDHAGEAAEVAARLEVDAQPLERQLETLRRSSSSVEGAKVR